MGDFNYYHSVLSNVWNVSLSDYDIRELLITVSDDIWQQIKDNATQYCPRIQKLIHQVQTTEWETTPTIIVRELGDEEWMRMEIEKQKAFKSNCDKEWNVYKTKHNLSAPLSELDQQKTELIETIELTKKTLEGVMLKQSKKYLPPTQRKTDPPKNKEEVDLISKIGFMKNELKNIEDRIVKEHNDWEYYARRDREEKEFNRLHNKYYAL